MRGKPCMTQLLVTLWKWRELSRTLIAILRLRELSTSSKPVELAEGERNEAWTAV
jgi:hypothetical protein